MKNLNRQISRALGIAAALLLASITAYAQKPTATGWINATFVNRSGIVLSFQTDPSGVSLTGSGTAAATLDFGTVSMFGGTVAPGVTRTLNGTTSFTISSPFDVQVVVAGITSPNYSLSACLQTADGVDTWGVDSATLPSCSNNTVQIAANSSYSTAVAHTVKVTIPRTAAAGTLSNTVNFTAVSN
jgi:hypothetical protein